MKAFENYLKQQQPETPNLAKQLASIMETDNRTTEIVVLIDSSGSMGTCQKDTEGSINTFIEDQQNKEGRARITLATFDTNLTVQYHGDLQECSKFSLKPSGLTSLNDAAGQTIQTILDIQADLPQEQVPGAVVFVIATDGGENSSTDYTTEQVQKMIRECTEERNWVFTFLGADYDAVSDRGYASSASNAVNFSKGKTEQAYGVVSAKLGSLRSMVSEGVECDTMQIMSYNDEERQELE